MMSTPTTDRVAYLREYLRQKLEDHADGDLFLEDGDDRIIWVSQGDEIELIVITLAAGKIEVQG